MRFVLSAMLTLLAALLCSLSPALADGEGCPGLVARRDVQILPAALRPDEVGLTYVGHSTFLIESPGGVRIATDYNDYVRPSVVPDMATMNHAHSTHFTDHPDPGIRTVLRGWAEDGRPGPRHDVTVGDVHVRNVLTNIRTWGGGGTVRDGNSIFVFETADLCIAHLGHLHHTLTPEHLKQLGRIDVLLVPVDGSYTLDLSGMMEVVAAIKPPVIVPMHFFGPTTLNRFLGEAERQGYEVERRPDPYLTLSRSGMPARPTVFVLPGR